MTIHEAITTNRWRTIARAKNSITVAFDWDNLIQACRTRTSDHSVPSLRGPIPDLGFYGQGGIMMRRYWSGVMAPVLRFICSVTYLCFWTG